MEFSDIIKHYSNPIVKETVFEFCKNRWVALEGGVESGRIFVRYVAGKPLKLDSPNDLLNLLVKYKSLGVRTVYASIAQYGVLGSADDVNNPLNIVSATPFWDIDVEGLENWRLAIEVAKIIVEFLERSGVSKSVYIVWSGEGAHVRLHEKAIPPEAYSTYNPVDVAYAIVEYVLEGVKDRIEEIVKKSGGKVKVENLIDMKRVFTVPLSLHRKHDLVAVVIDPRNLDSFDISWANPTNFRSDDSWRYYSPDEAENIVKEALKLLTSRRYRGRTQISAVRKVKIEGEIDRFSVMALLQAARYYILTGDLEKAKSFGLNRAIFYAYLKYYGRFKAYHKRAIDSERSKGVEEKEIVRGPTDILPVNDGAEISSRGYFMIGGKEQTPEDFDRQIVRKIEAVLPFDLAWEAALKYVARFPKHILVDPQKFYKHVYEPVRDGFVKKVVEELIEPVPQEEVQKIVKIERKPVNVEPLIKHHTLLKWFKQSSSQQQQRNPQDSQQNQQQS
jgi:hypothetical protein